MLTTETATPLEVPGPDGRELSDWLKLAILFGGWALYQAIYNALTKRVRSGQSLATWAVLDDKDRAMIRDALERVLAPSLLIGRAKLRKAVGELEPAGFQQVVKEAKPLSVGGSLAAFGPALMTLTRPGAGEALRHRIKRDVVERSAVVEQAIIDRIREGIESDKTLAYAPTVERLLLGAGLLRAQPYLPMVIRTQVMDAVNEGQWDEFREEGLARAFPVWQYHAVIRPTSRPWHAIRNGRYWPSAATFEQVRGYGPVNVCNCLCNWSPVRRERWEMLKRYGVQAEPW